VIVKLGKCKPLVFRASRYITEYVSDFVWGCAHGYDIEFFDTWQEAISQALRLARR